jgi:hypothetical protein
MKGRLALVLVGSLVGISTFALGVPKAVHAAKRVSFTPAASFAGCPEDGDLSKTETIPFAQNTISENLTLYFSNGCFYGVEHVWVSSGSGVMGSWTGQGAYLNYGENNPHEGYGFLWMFGDVTPASYTAFTWPRTSVAWYSGGNWLNGMNDGGNMWSFMTQGQGCELPEIDTTWEHSGAFQEPPGNAVVWNSGNTTAFTLPQITLQATEGICGGS